MSLAEELHSLLEASDISITISACHRLIKQHNIQDSIGVMRSVVDIAMELSQTVASATSISLAGVQPKWWSRDGYLYKQDYENWDDPTKLDSNGLVEHICCRVLDHIRINGVMPDHVHYDACMAGGLPGCRCSSYRRPGENEMMFTEILRMFDIEDFRDNPLFSDVLHDVAVTFLCDAMVFNADRTTDNLIMLESDTKRLAPVFDMGYALGITCDGDDYEPEPFGAEQVEWAYRLLGQPTIEFDEEGFTSSFCIEGGIYDNEVVSLYLNKAINYVRRFIDGL